MYSSRRELNLAYCLAKVTFLIKILDCCYHISSIATSVVSLSLFFFFKREKWSWIWWR